MPHSGQEVGESAGVLVRYFKSRGGENISECDAAYSGLHLRILRVNRALIGYMEGVGRVLAGVY